MPLPAHRLSKTRTHRRRAIADRIATPLIASCPKCRKPILPHTVCGSCGYYRGREVIDVLAKLTKKERKRREKEEKQEARVTHEKKEKEPEKEE